MIIDDIIKSLEHDVQSAKSPGPLLLKATIQAMKDMLHDLETSEGEYLCEITIEHPSLTKVY